MEAISETTISRTLGELENYLSSYSDLPREIILKHDLLRVGHWFTDAALGRTFAYRCAFWFQFWALVLAVLMMLSELRGPRPAPRIDVLY